MPQELLLRQDITARDWVFFSGGGATIFGIYFNENQ